MNLFPKANQLQPYKALHREIIVYFPKKHYTCNYKTIYITANQQQYDMKNKKRLKMLLFSLAILFTGCDYWCQDEYHVLNNTDDTLQIIVNYDTLRLYGSWQTGENMDSRLNDTTHVVYPHSQIVLEEGAELCSKYYKPDDYRFEENDLQFWGKWIQHIYANTTLVEFTYWKPEKWTFKSKRRLRKYELTFDKHEQRAWHKLN